jgi:hypothetical protein
MVKIFSTTPVGVVVVRGGLVGLEGWSDSLQLKVVALVGAVWLLC